MNQHFAYVRRDATQAPARTVLLPSMVLKALQAVATNPEEVENLRPVLYGKANAYCVYLDGGIEGDVFSTEAKYLIILVMTGQIEGKYLVGMLSLVQSGS